MIRSENEKHLPYSKVIGSDCSSRLRMIIRKDIRSEGIHELYLQRIFDYRRFRPFVQVNGKIEYYKENSRRFIRDLILLIKLMFVLYQLWLLLQTLLLNNCLEDVIVGVLKFSPKMAHMVKATTPKGHTCQITGEHPRSMLLAWRLQTFVDQQQHIAVSFFAIHTRGANTL